MIDNAIAAGDLTGLRPEPSFSGVQSFFRRRYSKDISLADVVVAGIPLDSFVTNRPGARFGPEAIRRASSLLSWDAPWPWSRSPFEELAIIDYGDFELDPGRPEALHGAIQTSALGVLEHAALLCLGGDHYLSYPLLMAHAERYGPLALVHFDAHSDTWPDVERRLDHGTMFYHAAKEGLIDKDRSVQLGMRTNASPGSGLALIDCARIHAEGPRAAAAAVRDIVGDAPAYVTFDIDCLDPAYAPGTGTPVCGGLSTWQARELLFALSGLNVVGMDVVEVSPAYDHAQITALAGATIASDLLCLYLQGNRGGRPPKGRR